MIKQKFQTRKSHKVSTAPPFLFGLCLFFSILFYFNFIYIFLTFLHFAVVWRLPSKIEHMERVKKLFLKMVGDEQTGENQLMTY